MIGKKQISDVIKEYTEKIVRATDPEKIILFGSHAWGTPNKDSDLDFYVVANTKDRFATRTRIDRALRGRNRPIDILVNTPENVRDAIERRRNPFIEKVLSQGRILYERRAV